jgi:hypothetical protein
LPTLILPGKIVGVVVTVVDDPGVFNVTGVCGAGVCITVVEPDAIGVPLSVDGLVVIIVDGPGVSNITVVVESGVGIVVGVSDDIVGVL